MGISLSDHENRIKKLESKNPQWVQLMRSGPIQIPNDQYVEICRYDKESYALGIIGFGYDYNPNSINNSPEHVRMIALNGHKYETCIWEVIASSVVEKELCHVFVDQGVIYARTICSMPQPDNYITMCWGLKLYYNFSYNIYRLANSILNYFLKCLVNSFKGGVKEIWRLV